MKLHIYFSFEHSLKVLNADSRSENIIDMLDKFSSPIRTIPADHEVDIILL